MIAKPLLMSLIVPTRLTPSLLEITHRDDGQGTSRYQRAPGNVDAGGPPNTYRDLRLPFVIRSGQARQRVDFPLEIWEPHGGGSLTLLVDGPTLRDPLPPATIG